MREVREAERCEIQRRQQKLGLTDTPELRELREFEELALLKDLANSEMGKMKNKAWKDEMHALISGFWEEKEKEMKKEKEMETVRLLKDTLRFLQADP